MRVSSRYIVVLFDIERLQTVQSRACTKGHCWVKRREVVVTAILNITYD
jgi:hypothetical protein